MKSVNTFIKALSENYYLDFIIDANTEEIDFQKYKLLVTYNNSYYYELESNAIHLKRKEIIQKVRYLYQEALSEIYINISSQDPENFDTFLVFNIEAIKFNLKILKIDMYIESKNSKYHSIADDDPEATHIDEYYLTKAKVENFVMDKDFFKLITQFRYNRVTSLHSLRDLHERYKALSSIPFSLFHIAYKFLLDLYKIQVMINNLKESKQINPKIKWSAKKTHIGYILGTLAQNGYIEAPKHKNGEINFTAYAKLIKQNFEVDVNEETLRKYLNPDDDKFVESQNAFSKESFNIPNVKTIS